MSGVLSLIGKRSGAGASGHSPEKKSLKPGEELVETSVVASVEPSQAWTTQFMKNLVATFKEEWGKEMKAHKEEVQQEMKQDAEKLEKVERDMLKKSQL